MERDLTARFAPKQLGSKSKGKFVKDPGKIDPLLEQKNRNSPFLEESPIQATFVLSFLQWILRCYSNFIGRMGLDDK